MLIRQDILPDVFLDDLLDKAAAGGGLSREDRWWQGAEAEVATAEAGAKPLIRISGIRSLVGNISPIYLKKTSSLIYLLIFPSLKKTSKNKESGGEGFSNWLKVLPSIIVN